MFRFAFLLSVAVLLCAPVIAQETTDEEQQTAETEADESSESSEADDVDEQDYYELEQDDFDPSQDVVADQSLAFPTDI